MQDRRGFLKMGLAGGALASIGAVGLARWQGTPSFQPREPLRVLDAFTFAVVAAAAEAVVGSPDVDPVQVAHGVDAALQHAAVESREDMRVLAQTLNSPLVGLLLDGRPRPFVELDVASRRRTLQAWRTSRMALRSSGANALRKLCVAAHYAQPRTWAAIGYPGPPVHLLDASGRTP